MDGCIFCRIVAGDIPSTRVYEDARVIAIVDIGPASHGHVVVVPRAHSSDATTAGTADLAAAMGVAAELAARVRERLGAAGANILTNVGAAAGQTVFHTHVHVIPRYEGGPRIVAWQPGALADGEADALRVALG